MKLLNSLRLRIATLFYPAQVNTEMEEELRSHIQLRADDLERSGLPRPEAERRARIEFGGREKYKEECHEALGNHFIETLVQDVALQPSHVAQVTGIRNRRCFDAGPGNRRQRRGVRHAQWIAVAPAECASGAEPLCHPARERQPTSCNRIPTILICAIATAASTGWQPIPSLRRGWTRARNPSTAWLFEVSGNYFDALGIQPYLGHFFHGSDEHGPNSAPYIVLSWAYWHSHFQDDRGVVGRTVQLSKHPFTILGVAPPEFHGTLLFYSPDFFVPMVNAEQVEGANFLNARGTRWVFEVLGRLKPGVTPAQATADLNAVGYYLGKTYPKDDGPTSFSLVRPGLHGDFFAPAMRAFLAGLMLLAGLILLAACANLGSLFAARAADRGREVALRLALGSSREPHSAPTLH